MWCRTLIWGGISMVAVLLPTLRHFRVVNIVALIGTTYTTWFIVAAAAKHGMTPGAASRSATHTAPSRAGGMMSASRYSAAKFSQQCCTRFSTRRSTVDVADLRRTLCVSSHCRVCMQLAVFRLPTQLFILNRTVDAGACVETRQ